MVFGRDVTLSVLYTRLGRAVSNLELTFSIGRTGRNRCASKATPACALGAAVCCAIAITVTACDTLAPRPAPSPNEEPATGTGVTSTTLAHTTRLALTTGQVTSGTEVVTFASDRSGAGDIYVMTPGQPPVRLTDHPAGDWDPTWSPACADPTATCRIAFTSHRSGDSEIWTMDDQGRNLLNVTQHPAWDYWPAWSPDGETIAFISERDGDAELFIQPTNTQRATQLTFNNESDRLPAWSPDGGQIAFAAIRNGIEAIHLIDTDSSHEWAITTWPLKGTAPAWSPDGRRIGFVGWDEEDQPGIYVASREGGTPRLLWQGSAWLGSLAWATGPLPGEGEGWLLFSSWQHGNHEIYALPARGGNPTRVTYNLAWDDFPDPRPGLPFLLAGGSVSPREHALSEAVPRETAGVYEFAWGANLADLGKAYLVRDLGYGWAKGYVNWETVEPERGQYRWADPDNTVSAFHGQGLGILMRVHGTPAWARPADTFLSYPPDDADDFARFMGALAHRYRGQVAAYEIWNEPNLNYEWGYLEPDPVRYTDLLRAAYQAVKAIDPDALVISGGLASTGDGSDTAVGDLVFLQEMYDAGAGGAFDALGSHPYAFGHDPDYNDPWGLSLSRVVQQREVMVTNGDEATPIWITELGWVLHTNWDLGEHEAIGVDQAQQARYLVRAFEKTRAEWPWVQALFLFNLDFSSVPWYTAAEPMRWYSILNPDRTPRPAYTDIRYQMTNGK